MISISKRTIFIHIPRTAGTTIETLIEDDSSICKRNHFGKFNAPLNHLTLTQLVEGAFIPERDMLTYFKFTFVRNPWDRMISECFCPHIHKLFTECKNIEQRIEVGCNFAATGYGGHFLPQVTFIDNGKMQPDFIGRYEKLLRDLKIVLDKIGQPESQIEFKKDSQRPHYREYYTQRTKKMVEHIYGEDIERFKYHF